MTFPQAIKLAKKIRQWEFEESSKLWPDSLEVKEKAAIGFAFLSDNHKRLYTAMAYRLAKEFGAVKLGT